MTKADPFRGALAGLAAGLVASLAMNQAQKLFAAIGPDEPSSGDPATVKAANMLSRAATKRSIATKDKPAAGAAVHYATGAALGIAYGLAAEFRPEVTTGYGAAFGATVSLLLDEALVPAIGLAESPLEASPASHAFGMASHLVFGVAAEGTRAALRHRD